MRFFIVILRKTNFMKKEFIVFFFFILFGSFSAQDDCVFNDDYEGLTREVLTNYNKNLKIKFNPKNKITTTQLNTGEILNLSIGGCDHFNYFGEITSEIDFKNQKQIQEKLIWMVNHFFGKKFGDGYQKIIKNHQYKLSQNSTSTKKIFEIEFKDQKESNIIYETFIFEKINSKKTKISTSVYMN